MKTITEIEIFGWVETVYHSFTKRDFQPMVLNIIWGLVAVLAVVKILI